MAAEVKQQKEKKLKIPATGGGGILVIGGALIAAALGTAFVAHRARSSRKGRRRASSSKVDEIEEKDVEGLRRLLPSCDGNYDHGNREFFADGLVGIQRNNCEKSEINLKLESKEEKQAPSIELNEMKDQLDIQEKADEKTDNGRGERLAENMVRVQEVAFKTSEIAHISSEEFEIAHVVKKGEGGTKLEFEEEVEKEGEKSEGIKNSFTESSVKEVLVADEIEQEESLSTKSNEMNYQLEVSENGDEENTGRGLQRIKEKQERQCFVDIIEEDQKIAENHLEAIIDDDHNVEISVSGSEFNMTQFKNKQSFEELKMVDQMKEKVVELKVDVHVEDSKSSIGEEDEKGEEGFKGTQEPSASDVEFNMTQYESKQNFEEPEIIDAKEQDRKDDEIDLMQARVDEAESSVEEEDKGLEGTQDLSISGNESDMTQIEESETLNVEDNEEKDEVGLPMEVRVDEEEEKKGKEEVEGTQELPISDIDLNMTQCESKQNFEESENIHVEEKDEVGLQVEARVHGTKSSTNVEVKKEEEELEGTQELSISGIKFDMTQNESTQNFEKLELVLAEEKERKCEEIGLMEAQVDETKPSIEEEDKKKEEPMEETQDLSVSGTELNMTQCENKQNFEESQVAQTKSSIEEENEEVEKVPKATSTCSIESRSTVPNEMEHQLVFSQGTDDAFGIAQAKDDGNTTMKLPNLLSIDHGEGEDYVDGSAKVQGENCENFENTRKNIEIADEGEEEEDETEPSIDEDGETTEGGSEGTGDSSMESNAEAIWPTEIIQEEKELLFVESNEFKDKSETPKEIAEKKKEEYKNEEIMLEKRGKGADLVSMSHARVFIVMFLALGLAFGLVAFVRRDGLPDHNHQLLQTYHQICRLLFPSYNKAIGEV